MIAARRIVTARIVGGAVGIALLGGVALACTAIVSDGDYKVGSACSVAPDDGKCALCLETTCCDPFSACLDDPKCIALQKCTADCADDACRSGCNGQYPSAVAKVTAFDNCASKSCSVCSLAGIGDPCATDTECASNHCLGRWCSVVCAHDNECLGNLVHGKNIAGQKNACIVNKLDVKQCFPGCATDNDCSNFAMTTCQSTTSTDGTNTRVCSTSSPPPDGG